MDRFCLTQVYIFSAGTLQGIILGVNVPIGVTSKKHCYVYEYYESSNVTFSKTTEEYTLGADSPFTPFYFCN